jgi:HSP20 family protein
MSLVAGTFHGRSELGHLARHMGQLMDKLVKSGFSPGAKPPDWSPAVDICETADAYEVVVELAGVRREDIEVYTENRRLVVTGWRNDPCPQEKVCLHHLEIEEGRFRRELVLPDEADLENVTARYREGLLRIGIPKRPAAP